jgi:iron complex outermembrane recepter protein
MRKSNLRATAGWQALALLGAGALAAAPAAAQDTTVPASSDTQAPASQKPVIAGTEAQAAEKDDAIVVTGSRIVRPDLEAPSPVTTVSAEQFDLTGTVTVESLLNELPQIIPGNTRVSNNQGGEDFSTLDLRGLGPNRTLILVDGERVPASSTTGVVDIGTIPAGLIERVDVVTGGASAVYGSDAMAGVVNFILKDNYEGLEISSQYGISDHGDGGSFNIQGLLGGNFGDDRGNMTLFASYYTRDPVGQGDRDLFRDAQVVVRGADGRRRVADYLSFQPGDVITSSAGSATNPYATIVSDAANPFTGLATNPATSGRFGAGNTDTNCDGVPGGAVNGGTLSFNDAGQLTPSNTAGLCAFADRSVGSSRFNFNPFNYLVTPYKRYNVAGTARYDISDSIRLKVITNFTDSTQEVNLAPTPATGIVVPVTSPYVQLGVIGNAPCGIGISCHPDLLAALNSRPNPLAPFVVNRRFVETGPRVGIFNAKTQTIRGTLSGPLAHGFNWDFTASYGKTSDDIQAKGNINFTAVQQGLNGCPTASLPGCVPLDIFGPGSVDDTMLNFVRIDTKERREFEQVRVAGNITGNLLELPAGPVGIAVGAEARTDRGSVVVDDAQRTGNIYGFNAVQNQAGKVNTREVYGEIRVPILADMPFFHELSLEGGARYSDYSSAGGLFNWKLGAQWAPVDWLKFRGIYNKAARAPSIVELFQNGDQGFPSYTDPCNFTENPAGATLARCQADAPLVDFSTFQQNNDQVQAFAFGNPDLKAETAKTWTVGAVLTPNLGLGRFSATIDYYNITINDVISSFGAQFFLNDCYINGNAGSCAHVVRDPATGLVTAVNTSVLNANTFKTAGVDGSINFAVPFADIGLGIPGRLRLQEVISWLDKIDFGTGNFAGKTGGGIGGTFPEWKSSLTAAYDSDSFTAQLRWNYSSKVEEAFGDVAGDPTLPALSYFDLSLRKKIGSNFELTGIVENLFNAKPVRTPAGDAGFRVNATYYNPIILGRYFTIQAKVKM